MSGADSVIMRLTGAARHYLMGGGVVAALRDATLDIRRGEFVMVVGSSGCGKSTLLHVLGCLDVPTAGAYALAGETVSALDDAALSRVRNARLGFVFQQFNLLPNLTVEENVALPLVYTGMSRRERLCRAREVVTRLGLGDRLTHRPSQLSGGQSQRVAIARALVNDPDILLADEPTGNLDSATGAEIMDLLFRLNAQGRTVVMVTHDAKYAGQGSRRLAMSDGRIVEDVPGARPPAACDASPPPRRPAAAMSPLDLARIGTREGLLAHKLRASLTTLGIVIGVAGVIAMSSFSLGSKRKQADQIRALGANLVRVADARLEGERLAQTRIRGSRGLSLADLDRLREQVPGVQRMAATREVKVNVLTEDGRDLNPRVVAAAGDYWAVNNLRLAEGRFLDPRDDAHGARVAVVGDAIRRRLGGETVLGRRLLLGGTPYTIVGALADRQVDLKGLEATGANDVNHDLVMPLRTALYRTKFLDTRSELDEIQIQLDTEDRLYDAGTRIRRVLAAAHAGQEDFQLVIPLDLLKQKLEAQKVLDILTICVSSVALLVGGIGIMNIMLVSVRERGREIGMRRAVGATRRDIRWQFLSESVTIAVSGGAVGIALAVAAVAVTSAILGLPIVFSPRMIAVAVAAATATGLAFGIYPAAEAARKAPVEALRYE
jgi:macrolide transport system ATP-binding/permease protein